jgi:outer membrane protein TolC
MTVLQLRPPVALLGLLLAATSAPLSAQIPSVSLDDAVRMARLAQPSVVQARGTARNADAQARAATGAYLPSLTASTSGTRSYTETQRVGPTGELESGNSTTNTVNLGLTASVDLFTGFRRGADRRAARANQEAAEAGLTDAEFQAGLTATQQFFSALAAQQLVRVREAGVRRAEEQLNLSTARLRVGSATRSDSLRSVVNLGNARLALVSAESDVARTQAALARTLGQDGRVAAEDDSSFYQPTAPLDTAGLNREARDRSPRIQSALAGVEASEASLKAAKSQYFPTLDLRGSANWSGNNQNDYQLFASRQLQLGLSWPIFNRFQREQTITTRLSALDAAEATAKDSEREVQASLTTQYAALDAARVRIEISAASVLAATEDLRVVNERYRVGAATILDILNSQEALAQAEVDAITARFDYLNARAQIEALIGRPL